MTTDSRDTVQLRGEISIISEYIKGNNSNKFKRKLKTILKKHRITKDEEFTASKEDLKQALQANAQRLRCYTKRSEQYKQTRMFRVSQKILQGTRKEDYPD